MNNLKNKVSLIGRLGAQPEIVTFDTGKMLARFSIAVNDRYKSKTGDWVETTQWHNINAWGKAAELVQQLLNKGQEVVIEGKLVNRTYETKSGEKRYSTGIDMSEFLIVTPKTEEKA